MASMRFWPRKILIKGLEDDEYTVTEIKTADGYTLLKKGIAVVISRKDASASATVDGKQAAMLADNGSANALVPLSVVITSGFDLPATGDRGCVDVWSGRYSAHDRLRCLHHHCPEEIQVTGRNSSKLYCPGKSFRGSVMSGRKNVKRGYLQILLAAVLFLLALGLTMYPVVSNWYIGRHQSRIQTEYREVLEQTDTAKLDSIREKAVAYNKTITPGAAEEAYSQASIRLAAEDYVNQLNVSGSGIMGYVEIPKIGVDLPIYHGTGGDSLDRGTGHLLGSSLPVGGESTHTIITGHSGMASQKMFTDLEQLREGDIFYLHVLDETLAYEVREIHTVLPHDTTYLGIEPGEDLCTLVTCTPTGVNTHRLLVQGSRIPYVPAEETEASAETHEENTDSHWEKQYWLGVRLGLAAMVFLTLVAGAVLYIRRNRGRAVHRKGGRYVRK